MHYIIFQKSIIHLLEKLQQPSIPCSWASTLLEQTRPTHCRPGRASSRIGARRPHHMPASVYRRHCRLAAQQPHSLLTFRVVCRQCQWRRACVHGGELRRRFPRRRLARAPTARHDDLVGAPCRGGGV
jgi:hypothetical protein